MPSKSPAQARLMAAVAHGWNPPAGAPHPSVKVAKEFNRADARANALRRHRPASSTTKR